MYFSLLQLFRFLAIFAVTFLSGLCSFYAYAEVKELIPHTNNPILAEVDEQPLTLEDLKNSRIHEAMVQLYQVQAQVLKERVIAELAKNHPVLNL